LRSEAISRLEEERLRILGESVVPTAATADAIVTATAKTAATVQLDRLLDWVVELREGSFAPYSEQPLLRAFLVPIITFAASSGFQYFHPGF
jgi:hypothetical protein